MRLVLHHAKGDVYSLQPIAPFSSCLSEESKTATITISLKIPYRGKLSREKTFTNFTILWLFAKVFFREIWGHGIRWHSKSKQSTKVFSTKIHQFAKVFSLDKKASRYMINKTYNVASSVYVWGHLCGCLQVSMQLISASLSL